MARKKGKQVDEAYDYIKSQIITFAFLPGEEISDYRLESSLNMSRSPIREAIFRLEADGLISVQDGKTVVASINVKDIVEVNQVRRAIEVESLRILIRNGGPNDELYNELVQIVENMKHVAYQKNYDLDDQFHMLLLQAAGNSRMITIGEQMRLQISRARSLNLLYPDRLPLSIQEHEAICEALSERDEDKAAEALAYHLDRSTEYFKMALNNPALNRQFLQGIAAMLTAPD